MSLTLAFELAALRRLADPGGAVADARRWSEHVGVVTDRPPYVLTKFTRDHGIRNDFQPASEPAADTLSHLLEHFETDRFVLVASAAGPAPDGWEHRPVEDAADRAGWDLDPVTGSDDDVRTRTRQREDWP